MTARARVVLTEHLAPQAAAWLRERCDLIEMAPEQPGFERELAVADGLIVRTYTMVNRKFLGGAKRLRIVGRAGVGLDNIDVAACRERGIEVVYTPDANTQAVVEYVVVLLGDLLRPRVVLEGTVDAATWNQVRARTVGARQLDELTIGILGLGRIGRRLARVLGALGCRVIYGDIVAIPPNQREGAEPVAAEEVFRRSDVVTIHIDGREENRAFVGRRLLTLMKPEAIFINTSRGFVVDNLSLAEFLRGHPRAWALLDVHEPEPFGEGYPLLGLSNARLYPHLASRTETAMLNMSWVVRDVWAVLEGHRPQFAAP